MRRDGTRCDSHNGLSARVSRRPLQRNAERRLAQQLIRMRCLPRRHRIDHAHVGRRLRTARSRTCARLHSRISGIGQRIRVGPLWPPPASSIPKVSPEMRAAIISERPDQCVLRPLYADVLCERPSCRLSSGDQLEAALKEIRGLGFRLREKDFSLRRAQQFPIWRDCGQAVWSTGRRDGRL